MQMAITDNNKQNLPQKNQNKYEVNAVMCDEDDVMK